MSTNATSTVTSGTTDSLLIDLFSEEIPARMQKTAAHDFARLLTLSVTFIRSAMKASRSPPTPLLPSAPPMSPYRVSASAKASINGTRRPFSTIKRTTPSAARRRAKGSLDPVGRSSIRQNPTSASILSASATATESGAEGQSSFGPRGE